MDLKSLQVTEVQNCSHKVASNSNVATALKPDTGELQSRFLSTVDFVEPLSFLNCFNFLFVYNKRRNETSNEKITGIQQTVSKEKKNNICSLIVTSRLFLCLVAR